MDREVNPIEEQGHRQYDTKAIVWHNSPSRFTIVMVKVVTGTGDPFTIEGFSDRMVIFVKIAGGMMDAHYDPYKLEWARNEENLRRFLSGIKVGVESEGRSGIRWRSVLDGEKITPEKVEDLA